jgi:hypothetical protein
MEVGLIEVAEQLGVSERRARQLVASGQVPARRVSGRWLVDEAAIPRSPRLSRPMSARVAWEFIELLSGQRPAAITQPEQSRLRAKRRRLLESADPAALLRTWLPRRARLERLAIAPRDAAGLLDDARLVPSGISDRRSGMSAHAEFEGYVHVDDLAGLVADHLMSRSGRSNVWLHVSERRLGRPAPLGAVMADLADHDGPREDGRIRSLLREGQS